MDENEFFRQTVQHLARCLSSINPTPWEKVKITTRILQSCNFCNGVVFLKDPLVAKK